MAAPAHAGQGHTAAVVRAGDEDRFLSTLYAPEEKRPALFALYAFNVEIASVRDRAREPMPGEIRLQWWRDALSSGQAQGNPTAEALLETIDTYGLPTAPFLNYLDARVFDLYDDPMPSRTDFEGYCGETASALIQLAVLVLEPGSSARTADLAGHAGCAQAIAGLLRLLPLTRARGQCFIPSDILAAAGLTRDAFVSGETGAAHQRAVTAMVALGREHLRLFEARAREIGKPLRPAFLPASLSRAYFDRIEAAGAGALSRSVDISALRRHAILLRHALRGWR